MASRGIQGEHIETWLVSVPQFKCEIENGKFYTSCLVWIGAPRGQKQCHNKRLVAFHIDVDRADPLIWLIFEAQLGRTRSDYILIIIIIIFIIINIIIITSTITIIDIVKHEIEHRRIWLASLNEWNFLVRFYGCLNSIIINIIIIIIIITYYNNSDYFCLDGRQRPKLVLRLQAVQDDTETEKY